MQGGVWQFVVEAYGGVRTSLGFQSRAHGVACSTNPNPILTQSLPNCGIGVGFIPPPYPHPVSAATLLPSAPPHPKLSPPQSLTLPKPHANHLPLPIIHLSSPLRTLAAPQLYTTGINLNEEQIHELQHHVHSLEKELGVLRASVASPAKAEASTALEA